MIRFFELLDYNASLRVMWIATLRSKSELMQILAMFLVFAVFFGGLAYYFEIYRYVQIYYVRFRN